MKFKCVMYESLSMKSLALIGNTLAKLTKSCVLRITRTEMSFLVCEENSSPKQILVWCLLDARQFYNEYLVEAVAPTHEIYLDFPTLMFSSSLSSLKAGNCSARSVKLKLTHKVSPCLTIEIELMSDVGITRACVHDIPVKVLPKALWHEFRAPPTHEYSTVVELKNLKKVRSVAERLKKLCTFVSLKPGSSAGTLTMSASTHSVTVNTIFKNVVITESSGEPESEVRIDAKKLCTLLCSEALNPKRSCCSFLVDQLVHVQLFCDLFQVHFYVTAVEE